MFGKFFGKKLNSNQAINSAHIPSVEVQDAMKNLERIKQLNAMNERAVNNMPNLDARTQEMMRRNNERLGRK